MTNLDPEGKGLPGVVLIAWLPSEVRFLYALKVAPLGRPGLIPFCQEGHSNDVKYYCIS